MLSINLIADTDSYKWSHYRMRPKGCSFATNYVSSRGGPFQEVIVDGAYSFAKRLQEYFPTIEDLEEAEDIAKDHGPVFNKQGWKDLISLGEWPLKIRALREGTKVKAGTPQMALANTDPYFEWLVGHLEPFTLQSAWYPTSVATLSYHIKKDILKRMRESCDDLSWLDFKLHDFGLRGATCMEQGGIGGSSHLKVFQGTDNIRAIRWNRKYYGNRMSGYSINAAEHSVVTIGGKDNEMENYRRILKEFPEGPLALVVDGFNTKKAVAEILGIHLKDLIVEREGVLVVRPDSGDPVEMVMMVLELLGKAFGYSLNDKGYKLLHPSVRVIQGDGVNRYSINRIMDRMLLSNWSIDNITFGMGGALLQKVDRDLLAFANKCSAIEVNDGNSFKLVEVVKEPATDMSKRSLGGYIGVSGGMAYKQKPHEFFNDHDGDDMVTVFKNSEVMNTEDLSTIRERINGHLGL